METRTENTGPEQNLSRLTHRHSGLFRTDRAPGDTVRFRYDRFMFDVIYPYMKSHCRAGGDGYCLRDAFIRMFNIPDSEYMSGYGPDIIIEKCVAAFRKICRIQSKYTGTGGLGIHFIILDTAGKHLTGREYHGDSYRLKLSDGSAQEMDSADAEEINSLLRFPGNQVLTLWNESLFYGSAPWHLGWISGAGNEPDPAVWMLSLLADRYAKGNPADMDRFASDALAALHGDIGGIIPVTEIRERYAEHWLKSGISSRTLPDDFICRVFKKSDIDAFTEANPMILPYRSAETGGAPERDILKFELYKEYFSSMSRITGPVSRQDCGYADCPADGVQEKNDEPAGQGGDNAFAVSVIVENIRTISNTLKAVEEALAGVRKALDMLSCYAERKLQ